MHKTKTTAEELVAKFLDNHTQIDSEEIRKWMENVRPMVPSWTLLSDKLENAGVSELQINMLYDELHEAYKSGSIDAPMLWIRLAGNRTQSSASKAGEKMNNVSSRLMINIPAVVLTTLVLALVAALATTPLRPSFGKITLGMMIFLSAAVIQLATASVKGYLRYQKSLKDPIYASELAKRSRFKFLISTVALATALLVLLTLTFMYREPISRDAMSAIAYARRGFVPPPKYQPIPPEYAAKPASPIRTSPVLGSQKQDKVDPKEELDRLKKELAQKDLEIATLRKISAEKRIVSTEPVPILKETQTKRANERRHTIRPFSDQRKMTIRFTKEQLIRTGYLQR